MARIAGSVCLIAAAASLIPAARADEQTRRLALRLAEEAAAFERLAPRVLGQETLHQRARKPRPRFRLRIGEAARRNDPEWQERDIVSEYGFSTFAGDGALHELRQVVSVDGRPVRDGETSPEELARIIMADQDERKRELLKQFEEYGLRGAADDFGQLILLFTERAIDRYEFHFIRRQRFDDTWMLVFGFQQIDGPEALTVIDGKDGESQRLALEGQVWVTEDDYLLKRITLLSMAGEGGQEIRQEATVDYAMSRYGALLPVSTRHRDLRGGELLAENRFTYSGFRRFGASAEIVFPTEPPDQDPAAPGPEPERE